jgi:hypothetical protein
MEKIDLNSLMFNALITREDILKHVTQEEIYGFYMGENIKNLGVYHSPLREDNIPSFALYFHKIHHNTLMFKDFATNDCGDFVVLVMKLFNLNYSNALFKIAYDFGLSSLNISSNKVNINYTKLEHKERVNLAVKLRQWEKHDKDYWTSFNIRKSTLHKFSVFPISHVFYNSNAVKTHKYAYVYVEEKDGIVTYKIYQPFENKQKKWINNANYTVHQGYKQLPNTGELLIITKSLKDVMSIHDTLNIAAIGLQSESVMMKESVMEEYKSRFKRVVCLFDNDEAGRKLSVGFTERYDVPHIFVPELPKVTDFSDLVKVVGQQEAVEILKKLIKEI